MGILASQFPYLATIDRLGPLTIGEIAEAVGVTQPGATRSVAQLVDAGLVIAEQTAGDQRRRMVRLSDAGLSMVETAKRDVWPRIEDAVSDLCGKLDGPLLQQLAAIEDGLSERPLNGRGLEREHKE